MAAADRPALRTLPVERCPGCGGTERTERRVGAAALWVCGHCSLVHAKEYGDPAQIYVDGYMWGETHFGYDVTPPRFQRYLARVNRRRANFAAEANGGAGSWLDVGCGRGELLAVAAERGWRATGVEPVRDAAEHARSLGLDVRQATLEDSGLPQHSFDVVSAFHVVEHMPDALGFVRSVSRWVRPGGHVLFEVPNFRSFDRRNNGDGWRGLRPLEHIGHFSPATLRRLLEAAGLEDVRVRTPSYVGEPQTVDEALSDFAQPGAAGLLTPFSRRVPVTWVDGLEGVFARVPRRGGWALLGLLEMAYDRTGVGMVCVGTARVP